MKKVWLHRDHVYNPKPFYKQKVKVIVFVFFIFCIVYFGYQIFYLNKLITNSMETTQILVVDTPEGINEETSQQLHEQKQRHDSLSSQLNILR